jgi:hypothetical protein
MLAASEYHEHNYVEALAAAKTAQTLSPGQQTDYVYTQILNKEPIKILRINGSSLTIIP